MLPNERESHLPTLYDYCARPVGTLPSYCTPRLHLCSSGGYEVVPASCSDGLIARLLYLRFRRWAGWCCDARPRAGTDVVCKPADWQPRRGARLWPAPGPVVSIGRQRIYPQHCLSLTAALIDRRAAQQRPGAAFRRPARRIRTSADLGLAAPGILAAEQPAIADDAIRRQRSLGPLRRLLQPGDGGLELIGVHGFCEMQLESGFERIVAVFCACKCRQCNRG